MSTIEPSKAARITRKLNRPFTPLLAAALLFAAGTARADLVIGVDLPLTGPAAGLGIPCKNGLAFWPKKIGGERVKLIVLDDAGDPTQATTNARRFVTEDKVDVMVGSAATPAALAMAAVATESHTVQLAASPVELPPGKDAWTFRLPQSVTLMATGIVDQMKKTGIKSYAFIGYSDAYGESWLKDMSRLADAAGIKLTTAERFNRADTSVTAQAIKAIASKPDAILVVASGSGAAMPEMTLIEHGYKGQIYQTHSAASRDLIRIGGKSVEGTLVVAGLAVMPEGLPDSNPSKKLAVDFVNKYEKVYGAGSRNQFAAHIYDAQLILQHVVPIALKKGKPGTPAFRAALKEALEHSGGIVATQGVFHYSPTDHFGLDANSRMMLTVSKGDWKVVTP
ncbi:MAG TPA: ABC transporter substrate-binding protein [Rhodocyclaceae bacterium]|nr:ABC transporter substrate-binding protein [Rhodocyclaceae bacterium]